MNGAHQFLVPEFLVHKKMKCDITHEQAFSEYLIKNLVIIKNKTQFTLQQLTTSQLRPFSQDNFIDLSRDVTEENELEWRPSLVPLE